VPSRGSRCQPIVALSGPLEVGLVERIPRSATETALIALLADARIETRAEADPELLAAQVSVSTCR
jgi:hypothetical protein